MADDQTQQQGVETPNTEHQEAKNNLSDTAEFVNEIAKNHIYPELRTEIG